MKSNIFSIIRNIINFLKKLCVWTLSLLLLFVVGAYSIQLISSLNQKNAVDSAPKEGRFIQIGSEHTYIQEMGPKSSSGIVFIHGTGSWSELWKPIMQDLAQKEIYSIAVDISPFGFSYADELSPKQFDRKHQAELIVAIINKLSLEEVSLVGHSFGGRSTITAAMLIPEKLKHLTLVNVALGFGADANTPPAPLPNFARHILENDFARNTITSLGTLPIFTKSLVEMFVADKKSITPPVEEMYKRPLKLENKNRVISEWLKVFLLIDDNELLNQKELLSEIKIPVSIIWGDLDTVTPLWQAEEIKSFFPNASLRVHKQVGHIPMIENENEFSEFFFEGFLKR